MISETQLALLREWRKQWNLAERAMKIAEKTNEEYQGPSVLELRYSGRRIVEFFDHLDDPSLLASSEDKIRYAISDCHRARHDATDHATSIIASRLDEARATFGAEAVRNVFAEYPEIITKLAGVRERVSQSREKRLDRDKFYSIIEDDDLPTIMKLFERFKASEGELEDNYVRRILVSWGAQWGWIAAIILAVAAWLFPR